MESLEAEVELAKGQALEPKQLMRQTIGKDLNSGEPLLCRVLFVRHG